MNQRLVVFASGSGSNVKALLDSIAQHGYPIECVGLCTDRLESGAEMIVKERGVPVFHLLRTHFDDYQAYVNAMTTVLESLQPDLIVLAGYLKKIPDAVVQRWPRKIINIHPSLLPKFGGKHYYGLRVHQAVLDAKESETGCTVHYIDEHYDHGDIIRQLRTAVYANDTPESLQKRVLSLEHQLLPEVTIQLLANQLLIDPNHHGR